MKPDDGMAVMIFPGWSRPRFNRPFWLCGPIVWDKTPFFFLSLWADVSVSLHLHGAFFTASQCCPTVLALVCFQELLRTIHTLRPNATIIAADFSFLPEVQIEGRNAPLVASKVHNSTVAVLQCKEQLPCRRAAVTVLQHACSTVLLRFCNTLILFNCILCIHWDVTPCDLQLCKKKKTFFWRRQPCVLFNTKAPCVAYLVECLQAHGETVDSATYLVPQVSATCHCLMPGVKAFVL